MKAFLTLFTLCCSLALYAQTSITETKRGAVVETDRYRVEIRDGVVAAILNKLTGEQYVDPSTNLDKLLPHLPSGLGTQNLTEEREGAARLFQAPWWEYPIDSYWPNQHFADSQSAFTFAQAGDDACTLSYKGLSDGKRRFADETYSLEIAVEAKTGDLLITPSATSPRGGVYGVNLTLAPLAPAITIEAPIFDGVQLDRNMKPMLWSALWGNYWDYQFAALNGWKKGAVGIWCQDAEFRYFKTMYHMVNDEGLSLAFNAMNTPPYDKLTEAKPVTWRIQAYEKGWSEAVARFRDWRLANVQIAKRPDWSLQVSFVNMGVNGGAMWLNLIKQYFDNRHLERTVTFAATIREEGFDKNHANNKPYAKFKEDMQAWKESGAKLMAYLNPVIMWSANAKNEREEAGVRLAAEAKTIMPFQGENPQPHRFYDVQHLGHQAWQRWFLDWVKEYIQDNDADGIYHDEGQKTPLDVRGPIDGLTPPQGRAQYHYRTLAENPNSIHGAEHMTELNNVGASLGIGSGVLWGTAGDMRHQRIKHASPISNALHYPNGVIRAFPHYSEIAAKGDDRIFHWGMDLMEKRGEIAGFALQRSSLYGEKIAPYSEWRNVLWLDRVRATTFVWEGLRPVFPEDWDRQVVTYFKGAEGEDYRYVKRPWGTAFVEVTPEGERMLYGRVHGVTTAAVAGAVNGWPVYNVDGPAGLNPTEYYIVDPNEKRPAVHFRTNNDFAPGLYEGYVQDGFATSALGWLQLRPIPEIGNITRYDNVLLVSEAEPAAIWVDGKKQAVTGERDRVEVVDGKRTVIYKPGLWRINIQLPADVAVLVQDPPAELAEAAKLASVRYVTGVGERRSDLFDAAWLTSQIEVKDNTVSAPKVLRSGAVPSGLVQLSMPVRLPAGAEAGVYTVTVSCPAARGDAIESVQINGVDQPFVAETKDKTEQCTVTIPLSAKNPVALITVNGSLPSLTFAWE